jgi:uncharacterized membrane protein YdjX (TVP38/TMEM64 family)
MAYSLERTGVNHKSLYSLKVIVLLCWGLALFAILLLIGPQRVLDLYGRASPQDILDFVSSFGLLSAVIYIFLHAIRSFMFLPVTPLTIAGGYLFGIPLGLLLTLAGRSVISATITFYLSRHLLRDFIKDKIKGRYAGWDARIGRHGIFYVALMRILPLFPFDAVGYIAGASGISFPRYLAGSILGDLPGVIVLVTFGSGLREPGSAMFYVSIGIAFITLAISAIYLKLFRDRYGRKNAD